MHRRFLVISAIAALVFAGSAAAQSGRYTVDKVVAVVGNSAILYSDLVRESETIAEQRRSEGRTSDVDPMVEALEAQLLQKLLFTQAQVDSVQINTDGIAAQIDDRMRAMTEEAGSVAALERQEGKPVFDIRQTLREQAEEMYYAGTMREQVIAGIRVTPGEVDRFYRSLSKDSLPIIPDQYSYAQITKYPVNTRAAKQRVRERLLEMRERIINGERFDLLARMYSVDAATAVRGGDMDFVPLEGLVEPFAKALAKLQPGQISEVVETEFGFHIIELVEKKGDLYRARHILLRPVFTAEEMVEGDRLLDSLASAVRTGGTTFEAAALQYSDDRYSRHNGGLVTNHEMLELYNVSDTRYSSTKFFREELRGDYAYLNALKAGEISPSFRAQDLRGNEMSKIVKLLGITPSHPANLSEDYLRIEELALADKQEREFERWVDARIASTYVRIEPEFRTAEFVNADWVK